MRPEIARMKNEVRDPDGWSSYQKMAAFLESEGGAFVGFIGGPGDVRYETWTVAGVDLILGVGGGQISLFTLATKGAAVEADIAFLRQRIKRSKPKRKTSKPRRRVDAPPPEYG